MLVYTVKHDSYTRRPKSRTQFNRLKHRVNSWEYDELYEDKEQVVEEKKINPDLVFLTADPLQETYIDTQNIFKRLYFKFISLFFIDQRIKK